MKKKVRWRCVLQWLRKKPFFIKQASASRGQSLPLLSVIVGVQSSAKGGGREGALNRPGGRWFRDHH
jgi:hypothetical protein